MADNNINQDPNQDPFAHPIKRNNWWLYIFGGMVIAGIIIWFFIDWSYKNRNREPEPVQQVTETPVQEEVQQETLPTVTVEGEEGGDQK
ncbi:MAG: hypothetical protein J1F16_04370 [Muribaculaceae bacterium]|nr:hypothetical protein [Muribaculaceae bacterium]